VHTPCQSVGSQCRHHPRQLRLSLLQVSIFTPNFTTSTLNFTMNFNIHRCHVHVHTTVQTTAAAACDCWHNMRAHRCRAPCKHVVVIMLLLLLLVLVMHWPPAQHFWQQRYEAGHLSHLAEGGVLLQAPQQQMQSLVLQLQ
jgi:hypothetical protein